MNDQPQGSGQAQASSSTGGSEMSLESFGLPASFGQMGGGGAGAGTGFSRGGSDAGRRGGGRGRGGGRARGRGRPGPYVHNRQEDGRKADMGAEDGQHHDQMQNQQHAFGGRGRGRGGRGRGGHHGGAEREGDGGEEGYFRPSFVEDPWAHLS